MSSSSDVTLKGNKTAHVEALEKLISEQPTVLSNQLAAVAPTAVAPAVAAVAPAAVAPATVAPATVAAVAPAAAPPPSPALAPPLQPLQQTTTESTFQTTTTYLGFRQRTTSETRTLMCTTVALLTQRTVLMQKTLMKMLILMDGAPPRRGCRSRAYARSACAHARSACARTCGRTLLVQDCWLHIRGEAHNQLLYFRGVGWWARQAQET